MNYITRPYEAGDEEKINQLYKILTERLRTLKQYKWEWIETWDGQGEIWLLFDTNKQGEESELLCQYSLIPFSLNVFGKIVKAGKTENCMSHPNCRGKSVYFPHEKEFFETSKKRFDIFFTTTGNVANGAPGRIRKKLGYRPFDSWTQHFFILKKEYLQKKIFKKNFKSKILVKGLMASSNIILGYFQITTLFRKLLNKKKRHTFIVNSTNENDLKKISKFWESNRKYYGITANRSFEFLKWRILENPYSDYFTCFLQNDDLIKGFLFFKKTINNELFIEDIAVENKNEKYFAYLLDYIVEYAAQNEFEAVTFSCLIKNKILNRRLVRSGFLNNKWINLYRERINKNLNKPFLFYVNQNFLNDDEINWQDWYVTPLFFEGRSDQ